MLFTLKEILRWLGISVFEIFTTLVCFLIFTILLTLKVESVLSETSWWLIYSPLFIADALNAYFCNIVFIRMYIEGHYKSALVRALWSWFMIFLLFLFKYLHCQKLSGDEALDYSEVMSPVFILLQFVMVRACQLH